MEKLWKKMKIKYLFIYFEILFNKRLHLRYQTNSKIIGEFGKQKTKVFGY